MKLAYIVENYGQISETFVTDLVDGIARAGVDLRVFEDRHLAGCHGPTGDFSVAETGYATQYRSAVNWIGRLSKVSTRRDVGPGLRRFFAYRTLVEHLRAFGPDIAYIDHGNNAVLARAALMALGVPFVVHFHGRDASELLGSNDYREQIQRVFDDAAAVVVASLHIRRRLVLAGCPVEKIHLVHLGVNVDAIPDPDWETRRRLPPSVIHLGRLVEKKNPLALLHAFRLVNDKIPESTLTMVGDGPLRPLVEKRVARLRLTGAVHLAGALPHKEAIAELKKHRLYAQHSVTDSRGDQEGFSISILEAAANGLPVVSTLHDGIPENVVDGETGYLVPEFNYEVMAGRMIQLLSDHSLVEAMGRAGRKRVEEHFRFEQRVKSILALLETVAVRMV